MIDECEKALSDLLKYCRNQSWAGYDPYDGLNSPLARSPLFRNRLARTLLTQIVKRSPLNLRPLLGIKEELNPKALALFARAIIMLARRQRARLHLETEVEADGNGSTLEADLSFLTDRLASLRSGQYQEACWGYNFDWQSRAFLAPRGTPNVVCTVFAAHAYHDLY